MRTRPRLLSGAPTPEALGLGIADETEDEPGRAGVSPLRGPDEGAGGDRGPRGDSADAGGYGSSLDGTVPFPSFSAPLYPLSSQTWLLTSPPPCRFAEKLLNSRSASRRPAP